MYRILLLVGGFLLDTFIKRIMLAAGVALGANIGFMTLFNKYIEMFIASGDQFVVGGVWGLLALARIPDCLSLLISATIARVIINSGNLALKKL